MSVPPRIAAALIAATLLAAPARAQESAADSAAADTTAAAVVDTAATDPTDSAIADSAAVAGADSALVAADSVAGAAEAAGEPAPSVERVVPTLEGLTKVAVSFRDMVPAAPGAETQVEIWRGAAGQVLRFVTGGTAWAVVVRPPGGAGAYTLRDGDCSGAFGEDVQAGTPLEVPACATP